MEAAPATAPYAPQMVHAPSGVPHEITHGPSFAMLRVDLPANTEVVAEAGSMVARHSHVKMDVKLNAGSASGFVAKFKAFMVAIIRKIIGGETFFVNHFSSPNGGSVWIAPQMSGQITHRRMNGETLTLSSGAFLASVGTFDVKMKFGGIRSLLAKEGAFFLQITGQGDLWFNSYGGVHAVPVNGQYIVDNGHLVGFEGNLTFDIKTAGGGLMGFMASGEGLVCQFNGTGTVYLQSRNTTALVDWLTRFLPL